MGLFFNHNELSEYRGDSSTVFTELRGIYRIMWYLHEVYGESIRYAAPAIEDGQHSFKPRKILQSSASIILLNVRQLCNLLCNHFVSSVLFIWQNISVFYCTFSRLQLMWFSSHSDQGTVEHFQFCASPEGMQIPVTQIQTKCDAKRELQQLNSSLPPSSDCRSRRED